MNARAALARLRHGAGARSAGGLMVGTVVRIGLQTVAFVLLARMLGPEGFGVFAASLALASLIGPFLELGAFSLVVQDVSTGTAPARAIGNSLLLGLLAMPAGLVVLALGKLVSLPRESALATGAIGVAVFAGGRVVSTVKGAYVARGALSRYAWLEGLGGVLLVAAALLLGPLGGGPVTWALLYLVQQLAWAAAHLACAVRCWGRPTWSRAECRGRLRPGLHFAVGVAAQNAYTDIDKTMLARLSTLEATGVYSAAYRVINVVFLPLTVMNSVFYPRYFAAGAGGVRPARVVAHRVLPVLGLYGLAVTALLWVGAPAVSALLGGGFADSAGAIRLLAVFVPLQAACYPFADALTGSGHQAVRSAGQLGALGLNFVINLWAIPAMGWRGAAWATIVTQVALFAYLVAAPWVLARREAAASRREAPEDLQAVQAV